MGYLLQQLVNGVHLGALYALLAFAYAISHALLRRSSFVHGALFAFAGQVAVSFTGFGWNELLLVYPLALALGALAALAYGTAAAAWIGARVLEPVRSASPNMTIAVSLGVLIVLMEGVRIASGSVSPWLSPFLNEPLVLARLGFAVTTTPLKLMETATSFGLVVSGALYLARSRAGLLWRAAAQDERAAELMGVDTRRVFLVAMTVSGALASAAGVLAAFHYGNIDFGTGLSFAVKVLFLASLGGLSHPLGAACGGLAMGIFEALWDGYMPVVWRDAATYGALCALLIATRRERQ